MEVRGHDQPRHDQLHAVHRVGSPACPHRSASEVARSRHGCQPRSPMARLMSACCHGMSAELVLARRILVHGAGAPADRDQLPDHRPDRHALAAADVEHRAGQRSGAVTAASTASATSRASTKSRTASSGPSRTSAPPAGPGAAGGQPAGQAGCRRARADRIEHPQHHGVEPGRGGRPTSRCRPAWSRRTSRPAGPRPAR